MIPVRLTLQGIYSYQNEPQTIEFGPLLEAGLFGIFGAVGSGKSSILEAISLALYGEIERLNRRDDRNYNMMNLKSDRLYVCFEFSNYDGQRYRFECEGKKNKKQRNKVYPYKRKAAKWNGEAWDPLDHADGEVITGISYNNFKRTVIIPQGRFQEFLDLPPTDRSQMLQDLFSLDRFDLAAANSRLIRQNSEEIQRIEGHLSAYEDVTPEMLKISREQLDQLTKQLKKATIDFEQLKKQTEDSKVLKELFDRQEEHQVVYQKMKENEPVVRKAEQQLKKYQEARQEFATRIAQNKSLGDSVIKLENSIEEMTQKLARLRTVKEDIGHRYSHLQKATESHDDQKKKGEEAATAGKLLSVSNNYEAKLKRIENGRESVGQLEDKIEESRKETERLETELTADRGKIRDREMLLELRNAFTRQEELSGRIKNGQNRMEKSRQAIQEKKSHFREKYQFVSTDFKEPDMVSGLESQLEKTKAEITDSRKSWHHLKVQAEMAHHVEQLTSGEPCPLCGSTEHPAPAHFDADSTQIEEAGNRIEQLETIQKTIEKAILEWNNLVADEKKLTEIQARELEEIQLLDTELDRISAFLDKHAEKFPDKSHVAKAWQASDQLMQTINKNELKLKEIKRVVKDDANNLEKYREKLRQFQSESDQLKGEIGTLKENLSPDTHSQLHEYSTEEWMERSVELLQKIKQEKEEFRMVGEKRENIVSEYNEISTSINATRDFLAEEKKKFSRSAEELERVLAASTFESIDEVQTILKQSPDVEEEQERIRQFDRELHSVQQVLKELKSQIGDRTFDADTHEQLVTNCEKAEKELLELRDQKNYQARKLEDSQNKWKKKKELKKTLDGLLERAENLKILEGLFRGKGFVDYISTVYLREICEIANRRFRKLTNNHFSLILGDDNQFEVRDYLHGGQTRSIKTLSGGQTFQASLCLALALAESLQNQRQSRQNFFFLDEGFGTLDGDALRLVMESLKSLRQEDRVVGVISHVESLQDEMDMYLHIHNDAEAGSQIVKSWEL